MKIEQLQLQLHPRPNAHALDLGFSLLRQNAAEVYKVWMFFWLSLNVLAAACAYFFPEFGVAYLFIPWFFRPLIERAPLYILSRQVFGEQVTWRQALRAWPSQLGGGWFRMLTWWRIFVPGRGLFQAVYQLEGMRGENAAIRRRLIGKKTLASANWFGIVCAHFEAGLQLGLYATMALFMHEQFGRHPLEFLHDLDSFQDVLFSLLFNLISVGIIGPIYVACCFTLYLNRRATLEAWDVELMLRQVHVPVKSNSKSTSLPIKMVLVLFLALPLSLLPSNDSFASNSKSVEKLQLDKCSPPDYVQRIPKDRGPSQTTEQEQLRQQLDRLYQTEELITYACRESIVNKKQESKKSDSNFDLDAIAAVLKIVFIALGIGLVVWLLYRYREKFTGLSLPERRSQALEIAGLNIQADSLPEDVSAHVLQLWRNGQNRAALALLYRATLSRLVEQDNLYFETGSTEGDCLNTMRLAQRANQLSSARWRLAQMVSNLWQSAAYAHRFPEQIEDACTQWHSEFQSNAQTDSNNNPSHGRQNVQGESV
jgi:hypothetical protein